LELAAESDVTVLITGESGTGKELAAQAVHEGSARVKGPFVAVNCSALPETLLESELFGHTRGAFTGAVKDKAGRFEVAHGGTLFLDEIGDISPLIQLKLLRAIQEKTFERVGESDTTTVDVRIIAATNRNLNDLVQQGLFREDLFFRIHVFPIQLPPLRERRGDVPLLVEHFIEKYVQATGKKVKSISKTAMKHLMEYSWPGNVRQLENAVEHAFVTVPGTSISEFDLPPEIRGECAAPGDPSSAGESESEEREEIVKALDDSRWNRTAAAKRLGISRVTLWKRMKKHHIRES
ncbi:MAG: sigma-54 interaction domain-containing protein, partial [Planctomycetota bacterium]